MGREIRAAMERLEEKDNHYQPKDPDPSLEDD